MKIEIKNRWTGAVIFATEVDDNDPRPIRTALAGADLAGANLAGADLAGADDVRAVLDAAPNEVPGLLAALNEGRIDGSVYEGDCACLVGTIANVRGCNYKSLDDLKPDSDRPAEKWFLAIAIGRGATPDVSQVAAITRDWSRQSLATGSSSGWPSAGRDR